MGQETDITGRPIQDEERIGKDIPEGSGQVSDEAMNAIASGKKDYGHNATGKDHSTEHHEEAAPDSGVGAIQDREDRTSDIADIND